MLVYLILWFSVTILCSHFLGILYYKQRSKPLNEALSELLKSNFELQSRIRELEQEKTNGVEKT